MEEILKLRQWYLDNHDWLNIAGIARMKGIKPTYLERFVKTGHLFASVLEPALEFATEKGFVHDIKPEDLPVLCGAYKAVHDQNKAPNKVARCV